MTRPSIFALLALMAPLPATDPAGTPSDTFTIREYRIKGSRTLPPLTVEEAVYPFLGRARTVADIDLARAALEKAYHDAGFSAVTVEVPAQDGNAGIIFLQVSENPVGRLRVRGSRFHSPSAITAAAPELAEGTVLNFAGVNRAVLRLNRQRDLRITPDLKQGTTPGTIDIDLKAEDSLPLHGSIELNNRHNEGTTPLRLNGSLSYDNLWQAAHSVGFNFQVAPERPDDATVFSAWYLARFREIDWLTLLLQGTKQDSDVSTLGGLAVAGRGNVLGIRLIATLPGNEKLYHSISTGPDWKNFREDIVLDGTATSTPLRYVPLSVSYSAALKNGPHQSDIQTTLTFGLRGTGSNPAAFDSKRYLANGSFVHLRADVTHTHQLPGRAELHARVQGQLSNDPLINNEQFSAGGLSTVRGYLESAALGDSAIAATLELRSPSLLTKSASSGSDWRFHTFIDAARVSLNDPLPEQQDVFNLLSIGAGTRLSFRNHLEASLDAGLPLRAIGNTDRGDWFLSVRLQSDF